MVILANNTVKTESYYDVNQPAFVLLENYPKQGVCFQIYILQEYSNFDAAASYVGLVEKVHIHPQYKLVLVLFPVCNRTNNLSSCC